ncbi:hypothetical protein BH10PSE11_BH10PSE11_17870 [soil metagenome]
MAIPIESLFDVLKHREGRVIVSNIGGVTNVTFEFPPVPKQMLRRPIVHPRDAEELLNGCIEFLNSWAESERPKKQALRNAAEHYLRVPVPGRVFDQAFSKVFKLRRGRPRRRTV